jgi:hypothetical protein
MARYGGQTCSTVIYQHVPCPTCVSSSIPRGQSHSILQLGASPPRDVYRSDRQRPSNQYARSQPRTPEKIPSVVRTHCIHRHEAGRVTVCWCSGATEVQRQRIQPRARTTWTPLGTRKGQARPIMRITAVAAWIPRRCVSRLLGTAI